MISVNLRLLSGFAGLVGPQMASTALPNGQAKGSTIFRLDQVVFRKRAQNFLELDIVRCLDIFWGNIDFQRNYVSIKELILKNGLYIDLP